MKVIQRLQNRAARVFSKNYDHNASGESLANRLGWVSVSERYKYLSCCLIFKCLFDSNINNSSDDIFITNYKFTHETHQYKTRNNLHKCLAIPMPRTNAAYLIMVLHCGILRYHLQLETAAHYKHLNLNLKPSFKKTECQYILY